MEASGSVIERKLREAGWMDDGRSRITAWPLFSTVTLLSSRT
jgi:hypothetical protein